MLSVIRDVKTKVIISQIATLNTAIIPTFIVTVRHGDTVYKLYKLC